MEEQKEPQEGHAERKGPIQRMIDWTMGIIFCTTLIGLAWRFVILPLFTGHTV